MDWEAKFYILLASVIAFFAGFVIGHVYGRGGRIFYMGYDADEVDKSLIGLLLKRKETEHV